VSNVTRIDANKYTPEMLVTELLNIGEDMDGLLAIVIDKNGEIHFMDSDLSQGMLAHLALALQGELMDRMRDE
jgi:hypothetical protein